MDEYDDSAVDDVRQSLSWSIECGMKGGRSEWPHLFSLCQGFSCQDGCETITARREEALSAPEARDGCCAATAAVRMVTMVVLQFWRFSDCGET